MLICNHWFHAIFTLQSSAWMHHMDTDEMHDDKVIWELLKNASCYFEQQLNKTTIVWSLTPHLTK